MSFNDRMDEVIYRLGQIEAKQDSFNAAYALYISDNKVNNAERDKRLDDLEASKNRMYGAAAVLTLIGTTLASWVTGLFHHT